MNHVKKRFKIDAKVAIEKTSITLATRAELGLVSVCTTQKQSRLKVDRVDEKKTNNVLGSNGFIKN